MKFGSGLTSGDFSASVVVGTLRISFAIFTSAPVSVERYLTSSHAASLLAVVLGMPTMLPFV